MEIVFWTEDNLLYVGSEVKEQYGESLGKRRMISFPFNNIAFKVSIVLVKGHMAFYCSTSFIRVGDAAAAAEAPTHFPPVLQSRLGEAESQCQP